MSDPADDGVLTGPRTGWMGWGMIRKGKVRGSLSDGDDIPADC